MQGDCTSRHVSTFAGGLLVAIGVTLVGAGPAQADAEPGAGERIDRYTVALQPAADGSMQVRETIDYNFGAAARHGIIRTLPLRSHYDRRHDREYPITDITATTSSGVPVPLTTDLGPVVTLKIGNPDRTVTGRQTYLISYRLRGAVTTYPNHQELYWNPIGTRWSVPISGAAVSVTGPGPVTKVACFHGRSGSKTPCSGTIAANGSADFTAPTLPAGQGMTVVTGFAPGTFPGAGPILRDRWSWSRAFSFTPGSVLGALALLLLLGGGAVAAVVRKGRDERYLGLAPGLEPGYARRVRIGRTSWLHPDPIAVRFTPPDDMRPGQLGALLHERARTVDVTATILDLAVRGFIRIDQVGDEDWRLTRVLPRPKGRAGRMSIFESRLYEDVFRGRDRILLSQLRRTFRGTLRSVENRLETDITERGWFTALPSRVRRQWRLAGAVLTVIGLGLTWLLAARSTYGLLGAAVLVSGLLLLVLSPRMPARTAKGTALLAQAKGFQLYLEKAEAHQIRFEEDEDLFSRYLPFAIVLGVAERWAKIFAEIAASGRAVATPTWYAGSGATTGGIEYLVVAYALGEFSTMTSDALDGSSASGDSRFASASSPVSSAPISTSGFSGGGSTGDGGGGGGGSSW